MIDQRVERGQLLTLSLESWGRLGEAMANYQGTDVFVSGGIPGERVVAQVLRVWRKYVAARVVEVLDASPHRVEAPCPYYGNCSGCQWQHLSYDAQLKAKHDQVVDALQRVGGFGPAVVSPVTPSPRQLGYRNHARMTTGAGGALGFVHRETRQFVRVDHCLLMHPGVNDLLGGLQDKCGETTQLSIRASEETRDHLIQPPLKSPDVPVATGQKHYVESVNGRRFRVASPSFFQVNIQQTSNLIDVVRHALDLSGTEVLLDAYTGVGTFAILLAPYVRRVIAVEESSAAVADARENAAGLDNVEFLLGKTEHVLSCLAEKPDVVLLDPPRAGCQKEALRSLLKLAPPRVVYVSCDPETLARDLKLLCQGPYRLASIQPLDMFPQTHHVECVAVLDRTATPARIVLASGSPRRTELLADLGLDFEVMPSNVDEELITGETPQEMVLRLSAAKAQAVADTLDDGYVIGADSTVVFQGRAIGKPVDAADARRMLRALSGTRHYVTTGVTVIDIASGRRLTNSMTGDIVLRELSDEEIETSVATGTPMDKAGAYAIQDRALRPGELVRGCYPNVVGLPLCLLARMLAELGCPLPPDWAMAPQSRCKTDCPFAGRSSA
ncbi:MAG TPA: 23S rRNA (uracil(1939)-C(5))-methyltransferase RlmD [Dehalococcoidia bacterium]|nr:23S rRNA (uracil(1939)-C(5))-methyltransferase RlmD [Dehalococcoidia bacterium]